MSTKEQARAERAASLAAERGAGRMNLNLRHGYSAYPGHRVVDVYVAGRVVDGGCISVVDAGACKMYT